MPCPRPLPVGALDAPMKTGGGRERGRGRCPSRCRRRRDRRTQLPPRRYRQWEGRKGRAATLTISRSRQCITMSQTRQSMPAPQLGDLVGLCISECVGSEGFSDRGGVGALLSHTCHASPHHARLQARRGAPTLARPTSRCKGRQNAGSACCCCSHTPE